ncbi:MAG TPA: hypothetical protein VHP14_00780 [Anaerolineales bacterium]|nr:hypothetical protein [Anaerolineales bacterium]
MRLVNRLLIIILVLAGFLLSACGGGQIPVTGEKVAPSKLEPIEGSELSRVILTEKAAERIGVKTTPAKERIVPYSAVIYDTKGNTWIYTNPAPLTYVRESVAISRIEGDQAFLSKALKSKDPIVTVGVIEIYGAETGVSK